MLFMTCSRSGSFPGRSTLFTVYFTTSTCRPGSSFVHAWKCELSLWLLWMVPMCHLFVVNLSFIRVASLSIDGMHCDWYCSLLLLYMQTQCTMRQKSMIMMSQFCRRDEGISLQYHPHHRLKPHSTTVSSFCTWTATNSRQSWTNKGQCRGIHPMGGSEAKGSGL